MLGEQQPDDLSFITDDHVKDYAQNLDKKGPKKNFQELFPESN